MSLLALAGALVLSAWRSDYYYERPVPSSRQLASAAAKQTLPPHTEIFKFTLLHGSDFIANPQLCKTCHGADLKGGVFKSSCMKCHSVLKEFPHFSGDITKTHGAAYLKDSAGCKSCHGSELQGSGGAIGCNNCHNYPHSGRWSLPAEHGQAFIKLYHDGQTQDCLKCHGNESEFKKKYPGKFMACDQCHLEMPHPEATPGTWARGGHKAAARSYNGKCGVCHDKYQGNLPRFKSCRVCHGASSGGAKRWEPIAKYENIQNRSYASDERKVQRVVVEPIRIFWGAE
ncbi:MAG: hypothetical protein A2Z97_09335 [Bdellovibrionales bacterium GWB1_52_6]|nr:MAG: hypothetical protein A2Z97_09335 [Bdellovibrionales bacterium GWB1_52_6]OFZ04127.1 MAG: hypothetical protein A2X97_15115 [Bdellovibrionales bacterium GWA1_52_35]